MLLLVSKFPDKIPTPFLCAFGTHTYKKEKPCFAEKPLLNAINKNKTHDKHR